MKPNQSNNRNSKEEAKEARRLFLAETDGERRLLQTLIDCLPDEVWFCDVDGNLTMANRAAFAGLGFEESPDGHLHIQKLISELKIFTPEGHPRPPQDSPLLRSLQGATHTDLEELVRHPQTGEMRHRLVNSAPIQTEDGTIVGALAVVRDITKQRQAEEARRRSDALLRRTEALTKVGGWEVDLRTGEGSWTDEVYRIYGVARDLIEPGDIVRCMGFYAPESIPVLKSAFDRALAQGEPYDLELAFTRADGRRIWVRTIGIPEMQDGKVVRIGGNIMDITERKQAEFDLMVYKNIVSSTDDIISLVDKGYVYRVVNNAYLKRHDKKREEIVGHRVDVLVGQDVFDRIAKPYLDQCFAGETVKFTIWFDYPAVGRRFMAMTYSPYLENGRITGALVNGRDITDIQKIQARLETAHDALSAREQIARRFLMVGKDRVYKDVLDILLREFSSDFGYIGYLNDAGDLICPSMTGDVWERCRIPGKEIVFPKSCWAGMWGKSLTEKRTVITNHGLNIPDGHIALENAMAVPIVLEGELTGQLVLANKASGYHREDADKLERIAAFIAPILKARLEAEKNQEVLEETARQLERQNIALNVLLDNREREKQKLADDLVASVERLVLPYFTEARKSRKLGDIQTLLEIIERNLIESIRFLDKPTVRLYRRLTTMEMQVADLIKSGKSSKEIADTLNVSQRSVYFHRNNIRRKIGIRHRKTNLKAYLINMQS